jgi:Uri superfamily endonuclease
MQRHGREPGIYTLIIRLPRSEQITVGSLGRIFFPTGFYSYTGSARGPGGFKRLDRHAAIMEGGNKTRRWHIDYLLPRCELREAIITRTSQDLECLIAKAIGERLPPVPRFGCSDCHCISHLHYSETEEEVREAVSRAHASALLKSWISMGL